MRDDLDFGLVGLSDFDGKGIDVSAYADAEPRLPSCFTCDCKEVVVAGKRMETIPVHHSCSYCAARDKLIPLAVKVADEKVSIVDYTTAKGNEWTRVFSETMDKLWAANGQHA